MVPTDAFSLEGCRASSTRGINMRARVIHCDEWVALRDDVEILLASLIVDELRHKVAAMWAVLLTGAGVRPSPCCAGARSGATPGRGGHPGTSRCANRDAASVGLAAGSSFMRTAGRPQTASLMAGLNSPAEIAVPNGHCLSMSPRSSASTGTANWLPSRLLRALDTLSNMWHHGIMFEP